ncbi:MAG: bifunctional oligoribonuclease/PAP phosphatase NrnA [Deltaproteobacteria bacterium]|nr:bifunctional oligoribonuclease/PAP phosphatase NrnA [Deltaproteobacteria bacterium]
MIHNLISHLKKAQNILITSHAKPDGDAIGSTVALGLALKRHNKYVTLYNKSKINNKYYTILPSSLLIKKKITDIENYDTAIFLDCSRMNMAGNAAEKILEIGAVINIDHHKTNTGYGNFQYIDPKAASTTEMVYRLISEMQVPLNKEMAEAIYLGILTDTGSFRYSNTSKQTYEICADLMKFEVNPFLIARAAYGNYSINRIKLIGVALDTVELFEDGQIAIMSLTSDMIRKTGATHEDAMGLLDYAVNIKNVKIAALIKEYSIEDETEDNQYEYSVSLRSNGDIDVSAIAINFDGGGHPSAAGFLINSELAELKIKLSKLLK